ncbi:inositol-3-phosphate synthase [Dankookia sp. P2]|uniref:inositol-3-phosphate synthase n=1 Tax=Dankookia sp. P2 TaxID=3423955 RepID=UPI003D67DCD0
MRVGLVGLGNCASSFVQGLTYYRDAQDQVPGLIRPELGGYRISDIDISAAFDVATAKVGRDVSEAILAQPNNTHRFAAVQPLGVTVARGRTLDGIGRYLRDEVKESDAAEANVAEILRRTGTEVLVSYLPVGSQQATEWYAEQALDAGCAFVDCIPVFIASDAGWQARFAARRLPLVGDDIKSQVGATIVHRVLTNLFRERGVSLDRTYQLNFGGNADFLNMLERERLQSKKISKTQAVTSQMDGEFAPGDIHVGPSDFVPWLGDRKSRAYPDGRHRLRWRAAATGIEAGSLGLAKLRGRGGRCGALRQIGTRSRPGWRADRPVELLHEIATDPIHRYRSQGTHAALHRRRGLTRWRRPSFSSGTPPTRFWARCCAAGCRASRWTKRDAAKRHGLAQRSPRIGQMRCSRVQ